MFLCYGFLLIVSVVESIQYTSIPYTIRDVDLSSLHFNTSIATFTDNCPFDPIVLPFSFPFYDRHVSQVWIASDGYISLKPSPPCYCYFSVTNCNLETSRYDAIIAPYLTDLNPLKGTNETSIRYRIESDRLYVIWDSVPDYDREHFNSFMVILHKEGDIIFAYKNIQWPFRRTGYIHNGLIGIRPYIDFHNYTTRGLYQLTHNVEWNTNIMGNYVEFEDISSIVSHFCQPSQFIYNRVELFLLTPTEICVTPSLVHQSDKLNFTVTFSTLQSYYLTSSSIRCVFDSKISTSIEFLSSQKLLCIQPNFTSLRILNMLDVSVSLEVYSNVNGQWHTLSQTTPSTITVYSDHLNTTMLYDTCNGLGECDLCGYCYHNASASVLLPNQCLGSNQTPYTPSLSDCTGDQIVDDSGVCCPGDQVDCLGHCEGDYAVGRDIVDMSLFCCLRESIDCAGICDGQAILDSCGICSGGTTDHIPNSDCDCRGVCFGTEVTDCYVSVLTSNTTLEYFFTYDRQVSQSHSFIIRNDGEFSMIVFKQTPSVLNYGVSPTIVIQCLYGGEKVDLQNVVILPHTQIELNVTADISQIGKDGFSFAHRKRQLIDLVLTPLTRNETEGVTVTIDLLFRVTNCNEVDSITTCSLLPHCYACTYSLDTSAYSYYMSHPFSLFDIHSPSSVDTVVFSCLNGDDVSVCSSILDEVKESQRKRLLHFSWDLFNSFQVIGILGICFVIFTIILWDVIRLRKEKRFVTDLILN